MIFGKKEGGLDDVKVSFAFRLINRFLPNYLNRIILESLIRRNNIQTACNGLGDDEAVERIFVEVR